VSPGGSTVFSDDLKRARMRRRPPHLPAVDDGAPTSSSEVPDEWLVGCRANGYRVALDPAEEIGMAQERCNMWVPNMSSSWWSSKLTRQSPIDSQPEGRRGSWPNASQEPSAARAGPNHHSASGSVASIQGADASAMGREELPSPPSRSHSSPGISPLAHRVLTKQFMLRWREQRDSDAALDSSSSDEESPAEPADAYSPEIDDEKLGGCYDPTL